MAMVRPSNLDGNPRGVISKRVTFNNNHSYSMFFWGGDNLNIDIVGTDNRFPSDSIFIENQWYLTEVLYNGNLPSSQRTSLYISGDLDKTVTENSGIINNFISDLTIAALNANYANTFEGDIAEVIIYRSALTSTQRIIVENYFAVKYGTDISSEKFMPTFPPIQMNWAELVRNLQLIITLRHNQTY